MKKLFAFLFLLSFVCCAEETNLIPAPFKGWYRRASAQLTFADGIYTITANTDPKVNGFQRSMVMIPLKGASLQNRKFELSFKYRTAKLNGGLQVLVRETFGKRGIYHGASLKRWDVSPEWKEFKCTFTTRSDAEALGLYIAGRYMKGGEKVELKDLKLILL